MNQQAIRQQAAQWMIARGWKSKLGKRTGFVQSLFEHTDAELNALLTLLPILGHSDHYGFSPQEEQALIVGTIAHDVGKERTEWQHYVQLSPEEQKGHFVPHIIPELTKKVVPELVHHLGFDESVIPDAIVFVNTHMAAAKTAAAVISILAEKRTSNRWATLAKIVDAVDNFCSTKGIFEALKGLESCIFARHLRIAHHLVWIRGVSTTLLHQAAMEAYTQAGWSPLLHFSNGTIYVADSTADVADLSVAVVEARLGESLNNAMNVDFTKLVVGNPLQTFIPKPEFLDYHEFRAYLKEASRRVRRGSFLRKLLPERREKVENYYQAAGKDSIPTDAQVAVESERIDRAQPEMYVFKFFKKALSEEILGKDSIPVDQAEIDNLEQELRKSLAAGEDSAKAHEQYEKALRKLEKAAWQRIQEGIKAKYDAIFGDGSYQALPTSTPNPAKEMAAAIDCYWQTPGVRFGLPYATMELAPDNVRTEKLIDVLAGIASEVYTNLPEEYRPTRAAASELSGYFMSDLIHPAPQTDPRMLAEMQLRAYEQSKVNAKRTGDIPHLCPICNQHFTKGAIAIANLVGKGADAHTNRAVAHGKSPIPRVLICNTCKYELFLRQLLLGSQTTGLLVLFPRMNIGPWSGDALRRMALQIQEYAGQLMSNSTTNPDEGITLSLTQVIAGRLLNERTVTEGDTAVLAALEPGLGARQLVELLTYKPNPKTKERNRQTLAKELQQIYELPFGQEYLDLLNQAWETSYLSWDALLDGVWAGEIKDEKVSKLREKKKDLQELLEALQSAYNLKPGREEVRQLNDEWSTAYGDWDALIDGVWAGEVHNETMDEIRARVYKLNPLFKIICQTPHMILVPLAASFKAGNKESDANGALRELFVTILLGLTLDCSVAVLDNGEPITLEGGEGVARVPGVPAIRDLVGSEWVGLVDARKWLRAVGAASLLANDASYPDRSNLYQILSASGPGHILRRIEQQLQKKQKNGQANYRHIQLIETLKEVLHA
ncbi:MAG: hypothetical protein FJ022_07965 [Chloroflexi bacterium]|nr:hypothetical protein [Chloroflexota bacterium]MBM4450707.1 hypothetical protein [Chloroflexota bacterium]